MPVKDKQDELQKIEVADAWADYAEATRGLVGSRYYETEPWAWARLMQRLRAIERKP